MNFASVPVEFARIYRNSAISLSVALAAMTELKLQVWRMVSHCVRFA
ncbi:unnamed protein product, partial [Tuber aestivum]